jgi:hypothetical protein
MSEKQQLIKKMLQMQKKFVEYEQSHGVDPADYWNPPEGHPLHKYREQYDELAAKLVELAHAEKGSKR